MRSNRGLSYDTKSKSNKNNKASEIIFLLIADDKFGIQIAFNTMTEPIKTILKKYSSEWNRQCKLWECNLENYKSCFYDFKQLLNKAQNNKKVPINILKIPQFVFKGVIEMGLELEVRNNQYSTIKTLSYSQIQTSIEPRVLPFYSRLYDFQKESLQFGIKKHGRLLLADEMGVGKTIQSLAIISIYRHEWPFLIICPSTLRLNWQQQILNWLGDYIKKTEIQVYLKGGTTIRQNIKALIVSYDLAWKIRDMLDNFRTVIADEAHYLKNSGNKRSDILTPFLSSRKRVILLTGTPAFARPREIYNLISIIRPDIFVNFKEFGYRYCEPTLNPWSRTLEFNGCQNSKELHYLLKNRIMIRRLKKEVLTQLPDKQRQKLIVETDKNIIKEIKQLLNNQSSGGFDSNNLENLVLDALCNFNGADESVSDARQAISLAYSLTGRAKLQSVKQYVIELLENNIKVILFAHHIQVLNGLQEAVKQKNYKYIRIDGTVSNEKRHESVNAFQENQQIKVAILSITAAGVGLTLTAASTVVFAELHWTPGIMIQAEDRAHRIGQKSSVNCHYLLGENTLDTILYHHLQRKINNVSSFVDGKADRLEIEVMEKGGKGKFTMNESMNESSNSNSSQNKRQTSILFKFQSIKPVVDKYFMNKSQDTQISDTNYDRAGSDIEDEIYINHKKRQPYEIKQLPQKQQNIKIQEVQQPLQVGRKSSDICDFILENTSEIMAYSQELSSCHDSGQTE